MRVGQLVDLVFNEWLEGTYASAYNALGEPVGPDDETLVLKYEPNGPSEGGLLAIYDELCTVVQVIGEQRKLVVIRGVRGTSRAPHAAGALVEASPRYWRALVRRAAYLALKSWPQHLYRYESVRTTAGTGDLAIEIRPASQLPVRRVLKVRRGARVAADPRHYELRYESACNVAEEGDCWVYLDQAIPRGTNITVHLATDWNPLDEWDDTTELADVGLTDSQAEALVLTTVWKLVTGREVRRLQVEAQGQSRTPNEVPAQSNAQLGIRLKVLSDDAVDKEIARLVHRESHL